MLHYIKGRITHTMPGMVCIENGGIGYEVHVTDHSSAYLSGEGEMVTLYTAMMVREDDISLYGFTEKDSLAMFRLLQTVQGIGAKAAMSVLSALPLRELKRAIAAEDVNSIQMANGVGKKTAQRIVLELKDKVGRPEAFEAAAAPAKASMGNKARAEEALVALGFSKAEAALALTGIGGEDLSIQEYIKLALRNR